MAGSYLLHLPDRSPQCHPEFMKIPLARCLLLFLLFHSVALRRTRTRACGTRPATTNTVTGDIVIKDGKVTINLRTYPLAAIRALTAGGIQRGVRRRPERQPRRQSLPPLHPCDDTICAPQYAVRQRGHAMDGDLCRTARTSRWLSSPAQRRPRSPSKRLPAATPISAALTFTRADLQRSPIAALMIAGTRV